MQKRLIGHSAVRVFVQIIKLFSYYLYACAVDIDKLIISLSQLRMSTQSMYVLDCKIHIDQSHHRITGKNVCVQIICFMKN